jgi:hypothetical protein
LQVSGITFTADLRQPAGSRVSNIMIQGEPIDLDRVYTVATRDFLIAGGDGYTMFEETELLEITSTTEEALMNAIIARGTINPSIEGRITMIGTDGNILPNPGVSKEVELVSVTPTAFVTQLQGNENELTITVVETFSNGHENVIVETFRIRNNALGFFEVGGHTVFVNTQGNTQIREIQVIN